MAQRITVFYSWQSDTPPRQNREFIEHALREALKRLHSDAALENALRDTKITLDRDTEGVPGSPPIAETILHKIEECAVFVADLTFVGASKGELVDFLGKPRLFPNPNVLVEYGYALRCHSHAKVIGVMNTAYGAADAESLPFDLRHLRWPIQFHLEGTRFFDDEAQQREKLVAALVNAIGLVLAHQPTAVTRPADFISHKATKNAAIFYDDPRELLPDDNVVSVPDGAKAYLRLYPKSVVPLIETELEARHLATSGGLQPMGRANGWNTQRNIFGSVVSWRQSGGDVYYLTQLFLSREIWGLDARVLNAQFQREIREHYGGVDRNYIATGYLEEYYVRALQNYLAFAKTHLELPPPLKIEAGLVGIKGYALAVNTFHVAGSALRDIVQWRGDADYEGQPVELLRPFFERIWANCDFQRPPERQTELIAQLAKNG